MSMQRTTLNDLEDLVLTVRDRNTRSYITEAITAYRAGALRSALISTWIAVAYDLIAKIRELASQGDTEAGAFVKELDEAIEQHVRGEAGAVPRLQKIENDLLDKGFNQFEFLSRQEYIDLVRLKDDRNLCAHPAFTKQELLFQPSPELVRSHIAHAVNHLLQHPPVQGKNALARLKQDLLQPSFPKDQSAVSAFMELKYLKHIKPALLNNFITVFLKILLKDAEPDLRGKEDDVLRCLSAVRQHNPDLYETKMAEQVRRLTQDLPDAQLKRVIRLFSLDSRCWNWLDPTLHIRLQTIVQAYTYDDGASDYLFDGLVIDDLRPQLLAALGRLNEHEQMLVIGRNPRPEFAETAIDLYRAAGSWRGAESLAANLILPLSDVFTPAHIERITEAVAANTEIRDAHGSQEQVTQLFDRTAHIHAATRAYWERLAQRLADAGVGWSLLERAMTAAGMITPPRPASPWGAAV
jgi:hypothetical protein